MSTERGKSHLAPPALKSPKLVLAKNAKFCLKKKAMRLITLKKVSNSFP
jgi:hypothetical protein